ncbi:hypothetical protein CI238_12922 [Colletotrichum incanum]|uniref:Uncharacterized protein n=1 Tax=Colletotrichum incanum TaxID=1573173 RepID=A0A161WGZ5_COLIC|nr:hypothetical protein CI238_12922 [Colletotrichum incanum]
MSRVAGPKRLEISASLLFRRSRFVAAVSALVPISQFGSFDPLNFAQFSSTIPIAEATPIAPKCLSVPEPFSLQCQAQNCNGASHLLAVGCQRMNEEWSGRVVYVS